MMFDGCLKLIDVDGCMKAGTTATVDDNSLSFTPCYCAPEWARFLVHPDENTIQVVPALDGWSVGITICELAVLDPVLRPIFASFLKHGRTHRQAGFLFMDWLSNTSDYAVPEGVTKFDAEMGCFLQGLLQCDASKRHSLPQALSHEYLAAAALRKERNFDPTGNSVRSFSCSDGGGADSPDAEDAIPTRAPRHLRPMVE